MDQLEIKALLERVASRDCPVGEALMELKLEPFQDLGFAKVDRHRGAAPGDCRGDLRRWKDAGTDSGYCRVHAGGW